LLVDEWSTGKLSVDTDTDTDVALGVVPSFKRQEKKQQKTLAVARNQRRK
jgi:hypothetical protein